MFERYTEKARRVIFFARYEASQFGSSCIETEHLLLGLLREDKALTNRFLHSHASMETFRKQVEAHTTIREKVSTSVDLPLSNECKRVLAYAGEEAEQFGHKHIGTEHLLLGLLREEKCFAAQQLIERGVEIGAVRDDLKQAPHPSTLGTGGGPTSTPEAPSITDLTQAATEDRLDPVIGRSLELDALIETLCCHYKNNPVLIGDRGVGKTAIVEALAQRVAGCAVPPLLAGKRIVSLDPVLLASSTHARARGESLLETLASSGNTPGSPSTEPGRRGGNTILFLDELHGLLAAGPRSATPDAIATLRQVLSNPGIPCISACTPADYQASLQAFPWLADFFRPIHVRTLDEEETLSVLQSRKAALEKFHDATYTDEALALALTAASRYLPAIPQPAKALQLIDAAGALANQRRVALPDDVAESEKRIRFIQTRLENSIANHEFEKARFYSDEERKERDNLRALREQHHLDDSSSAIVTPALIEEVIARWSSYPWSL